MTAPDLLPVLGKGGHITPRDGACFMEYTSLLAGLPWSDHPACTHPVLASMARLVNDRLPDGQRHLLLPLIPRVIGTAPTGTSLEQQRLALLLGVWCQRRVLPLAPPAHVAEVERAAVRATRAGAADDERAVETATYFAGAAAIAAAVSPLADLVGLLTGLIDEHDRLTGRTEHPELTDRDLRELAAVTA